MMNLIDTSPSPLAAAQAVSEGDAATEAGAARPSTQASAAGDSIAYGARATVAIAYFPFAGAGTKPSADPPSVALEPHPEEALSARFGPQFALIRAALPAALQAQFVAQMMAAYDAAGGAEPGAKAAGTALSEHDLATLVAAGETESDDSAARALVSRLSHEVATYGSSAVATAMHLAHDRTAFAAAGTSPATQSDVRVRRRDDDERERRQRQDERRTPQGEAGDAASSGDGGSTYTIEDVVRFGDETIATHRMLAPSPNIERTTL
jgi:hypothetical protein